MSDDDAAELDTKTLDKIMLALRKGRLQDIKIGILGADASARQGDSGKTNAEIGTWHEFGTTKLPQRSFLRVPIVDHLGEYLNKAGAFDEAVLKEIVKQGDIKPWLEKVAVVAETVVMDGFSSGGFGKWASWKNGYTNNTGQILVDTQQLRNSISTKVKG